MLIETSVLTNYTYKRFISHRIAHTAAFVTPVMEHRLERMLIETSVLMNYTNRKVYNTACKTIHFWNATLKVKAEWVNQKVFPYQCFPSDSWRVRRSRVRAARTDTAACASPPHTPSGCVPTLKTEREKCEMFYLTTHSTHFIYGYMASDIWLRTILIAREKTRCCHMGYSFWLTARVLLYAPSHRQDSTYHSLCYTSRGALAGTRNSKQTTVNYVMRTTWNSLLLVVC